MAARKKRVKKAKGERPAGKSTPAAPKAARKPSRRRPAKAEPLPPRLDRYDLYEICAQYPSRDVALLRALHGHDPKILGEDFCGTGALSREWVRMTPGARAIATDHDAEPLARAAGERITTCHADVMDVGHPADVIYVGNFSICEWHARAELVAYLKHARSRLRRRGIFVCDLYGGVDAYETGILEESRPGPNGEEVHYQWEQCQADAKTGEIVNEMHFFVRVRRAETYSLPRAFRYRWRLWSIPELRDAMRDAGFRATEVHHRFQHAVDDEGQVHALALPDGMPLEDAWFVFVVGRT